MRKYIYPAVITLLTAVSVQAQDAHFTKPNQVGYQLAMNRTSLIGMRMNPIIRMQLNAEMQRRYLLHQQQMSHQGYRYDPNHPPIPGHIYW